MYGMMATLTKPICLACLDERNRREDLHGVWPIIIPPHSKAGHCRLAE